MVANLTAKEREALKTTTDAARATVATKVIGATEAGKAVIKNTTTSVAASAADTLEGGSKWLFWIHAGVIRTDRWACMPF